MTAREDILANFIYRTGGYSSRDAQHVARDIIREMDHHAKPPPAVAFNEQEGGRWIPISELRYRSSCFAILFENDWIWDPIAGWRPGNANAFRPPKTSAFVPPPPTRGYTDDDIPF